MKMSAGVRKATAIIDRQQAPCIRASSTQARETAWLQALDDGAQGLIRTHLLGASSPRRSEVQPVQPPDETDLRGSSSSPVTLLRMCGSARTDRSRERSTKPRSQCHDHQGRNYGRHTRQPPAAPLSLFVPSLDHRQRHPPAFLHVVSDWNLPINTGDAEERTNGRWRADQSDLAPPARGKAGEPQEHPHRRHTHEIDAGKVDEQDCHAAVDVLPDAPLQGGGFHEPQPPDRSQHLQPPVVGLRRLKATVVPLGQTHLRTRVYVSSWRRSGQGTEPRASAATATARGTPPHPNKRMSRAAPLSYATICGIGTPWTSVRRMSRPL